MQITKSGAGADIEITIRGKIRIFLYNKESRHIPELDNFGNEPKK